jgi:hypothetical protein
MVGVFFPGTAASSSTKTGLHGIAEILLKLALKHQTSNNQSNLTVLTLYGYILADYLYAHKSSKDVPCKGIGAWFKTQIVRLASTLIPTKVDAPVPISDIDRRTGQKLMPPNLRFRTIKMTDNTSDDKTV